MFQFHSIYTINSMYLHNTRKLSSLQKHRIASHAHHGRQGVCVVDSNFETSWTPINKMDLTLGLDHSDDGINIQHWRQC